MECSRVYTTNTHLDSSMHLDELNHTKYGQQRSTNTHIHTHTHTHKHFKTCAYLELHDEMCEVEFSLQVQSDVDVLLSCGGNVSLSVITTQVMYSA